MHYGVSKIRAELVAAGTMASRAHRVQPRKKTLGTD